GRTAAGRHGLLGNALLRALDGEELYDSRREAYATNRAVAGVGDVEVVAADAQSARVFERCVRRAHGARKDAERSRSQVQSPDSVAILRLTIAIGRKVGIVALNS